MQNKNTQISREKSTKTLNLGEELSGSIHHGEAAGDEDEREGLKV